MLELLLHQYEDQFGQPFPLADFAGRTEIDLINIIYECTLRNKPYEPGMTAENRFPDAPGQ